MMNKQELHEAFAAIHASGDLMKEVLSVEKENKKTVNGWVFARRAVACAAVLALLIGAVFFWPGETKTEDGQIIEVPGILKVYACDLEVMDATEAELEKYELSSNEPFLLALYNPLISASNFALPLTFYVSEEYFGSAELTFEIATEHGVFSENAHDFAEESGQIVVPNGQKLYFGGMSQMDVADIGEEQSFYADIVIYADGAIAGYGIISFCFKGATCYAYDFKTVCYPPVDGQLQNVSREYVQQQMVEYKQQKNTEVASNYLQKE